METSPEVSIYGTERGEELPRRVKVERLESALALEHRPGILERMLTEPITAITDREAQAIWDFYKEAAGERLDDYSRVLAAMREMGRTRALNITVLSGFRKLFKEYERAYPYAPIQELAERVFHDLYDLHVRNVKPEQIYEEIKRRGPTELSETARVRPEQTVISPYEELATQETIEGPAEISRPKAVGLDLNAERQWRLPDTDAAVPVRH